MMNPRTFIYLFPKLNVDITEEEINFLCLVCINVI